jgi:hypothetical protein
MNPLALARLLSKAQITGWRWSRPGEEPQHVLLGSCGVRGLSHLWVDFRFTEGHSTHHLEAERSLSDAAATVTLDGEALAGQMHVRKRVRLGLPPRVWLEVRIVAPERLDLRFEGRLKL